MSLEQDILYTLSTRDGYDEVYRYLVPSSLTERARVILEAIDSYYTNTTNNHIDWSTFGAVVAATSTKLEEADQVAIDCVLNVLDVRVEDGYVPIYKDVITKFVARHFAEKIGDKSYQLAASNKGDLTPIEDMMDRYAQRTNQLTSFEVLDTVDAISSMSDPTRAGGFDWPLDYLDVAIGPVEKGDQVLLFGRPEAGKTSLAINVFNKWAEQRSEGTFILFNNEEKGSAITSRIVQVALGKTHRDLMGNPTRYAAEYKAWGGAKKILVITDPKMNVKKVERICRKHQPTAMVFNLIDKVKGFDGEREDLRLRSVLQWSRALAHSYGPVLGIMQADGAAEGVKYLNMSMVYGSKTSVQGEGDVMIGLGRSLAAGEENNRFLSIVKNKLPGGPKSDPKESHGKLAMEFDAPCGRFKEIT